MIAQVRELKSHLMFGFLVLVLLSGQALPSLAQTEPDHVVINEVEINPLGDDSKIVAEWVELYNPTDQPVDVGGWTIGATSGLKAVYKMHEGAKIPSGGFMTLTYGPLWFPDFSATIQLKSNNGTVIDQTQSLKDSKNDFNSWQRIADGHDTDSDADWTFKISNAGASNGKLSSSTTETELSITVSTDKPGYLFGDVVTISGEVSKKVEVAYQKYKPEEVNLVISGPADFERKFVFYPDETRGFKSEMKTDKAFKLPEGEYSVSVEYAGAVADTKFTLTEKPFVPPTKEASAIISISTDKLSYIPGEKATITATTSKIVSYAGMKFKIFDPDKNQVYDGTLYPDTKGNFSVQIFINNVNTVFGIYEIVATYDKTITQTSYEVQPDIKEDKPISLTTDKKVYGLGDTVIITGRSNKVWIPSLDVEIVQAYANKDVTDTYVVKDAVTLAGDSTFKYELTIPYVSDRYGDYRVKVSKEIGSTEIFFKVVENPDEYVDTGISPLSIWTDKSFYKIGDSLIISGKAIEKKDLGRVPVKISITTADGKEIISKGDPRASAGKSQDTAYSFTGIPDSSGNFEIKSGIYRNIFQQGTYIIKAEFGKDTASTSFEVEDDLDFGTGVKILASTNKEVYGIGEKVQLTGKVSTFTAQSSYGLVLTDPDGKEVYDSGVTINKGEFSWSWTVPDYIKSFGIYKITISSDSDEINLFFTISKNPETETKSLPIVVETDKAVYNSGETVTVFGHAIKKIIGSEGLNVDTRPEIILKSENNKELSKAYPDLLSGGKFQTTFKLVPSVFKTGEYKVIAKYYNTKSQTIFKVDDKFTTGGSAPLILLLDTDKEKYLPGDTVKIIGKTNKIVSAFDVDITVKKEGVVPSVTVKFDPTGSFNYDYVIPETTSLGTYTVTADTDFDTVTDTFEVVSELPAEEPETPKEPTEIPKEPTETPQKIVDKINRIKESMIPVSIHEKTHENKTFAPRVFDGMLRVNPGDESDVDLKVKLKDGTCIIGQDSDCEIKKSTRTSDSLYSIVEIDGENMKIRYSGPSVRLEKFTILPEDPDGVLSDNEWIIEIIKDNQVSRFYYKVSYVKVE